MAKSNGTAASLADPSNPKPLDCDGKKMPRPGKALYALVGRAFAQMVKWIPLLVFSIALVTLPSAWSATLVPVMHKEGTSHGFLVLRAQDGKLLATGELIQTVEGERVTSEIVFHFRDGSVHDEVTVFSQNPDLRLISDHLRQQGPSFPKPVDATIDVASGKVEISSGKDSKIEQQQMQIPEDDANGLILNLLKNLSPGEPETTVSMVIASSKPRVVKLKIHSAGEQAFSAAGARLKAVHYVIHTDIGGVTGAVAAVVGKQPPDLHFWVIPGKAPTFMKFTGELFEGGPIWNIELAPVRWVNNRSSGRKR